MEGLDEALEEADGFTLLLGTDLDQPAYEYTGDLSDAAYNRRGHLFYHDNNLILRCGARRERCKIHIFAQDLDPELLSAEMEFSLDFGETAYINLGEWSVAERRSTAKYRYEAALPRIPTVTTSTGQVWMDRNLGASRVAHSITDEEAYGDLFQ
ncbi:MAG: hypothetical protein GY820_09420, partial [Gammaproteobacteria bacterium]|nr:hypothetical protein [Gammaproteobacteria bacterium]